MAAQMEEIQQNIDTYEYTQKQHLTNLKHTTQQLTTSFVNETMWQLKQSIDKVFQQRLKDFEVHMAQLVDDMLQDFYSAADESHREVQASIDTALIKFNTTLKQQMEDHEAQLFHKQQHTNASHIPTVTPQKPPGSAST